MEPRKEVALSSEKQTRLTRPFLVTMGHDQLLITPWIVISRDSDGSRGRTGVLVTDGLQDTITYFGGEGEELTLGRGEDQDFMVASIGASRAHAKIYRDRGTFVLQDNDSLNGTVVKAVPRLTTLEQRVPPDQPFKAFTILDEPMVSLAVGNALLLITQDQDGTVSVINGREDDMTGYGQQDESESHPRTSDKKYTFRRSENGMVFIHIGSDDENNIILEHEEIEDHHAAVIVTKDLVIIHNFSKKDDIAISAYPEQQGDMQVDNELMWWDKRVDRRGNPILSNREKLQGTNRFHSFQSGEIQLTYPREDAERVLPDFFTIVREVKDTLGVAIEEPQIIHTLYVPGKEYCHRACADATGRHIIMNSKEDGPGVAAHELVHAYLTQAFGYSYSDVASEGAATYFGRIAFPRDKVSNDVRFAVGYRDVLDVHSRGQKVGLSHTEMLKKSGRDGQSKADLYEYSYRFGSLLAEFLVENPKYGKDAFFRFYQATCQRNLTDVYDRELIYNGTVMGSEEHIVAEALRQAGLNNFTVEREFNRFIGDKLTKPDKLIAMTRRMFKDAEIAKRR